MDLLFHKKCFAYYFGLALICSSLFMILLEVLSISMLFMISRFHSQVNKKHRVNLMSLKNSTFNRSLPWSWTEPDSAYLWFDYIFHACLCVLNWSTSILRFYWHILDFIIAFAVIALKTAGRQCHHWCLLLQDFLIPLSYETLGNYFKRDLEIPWNILWTKR